MKLAACLVLMALVTAAQAQTRPRTVPLHDVDITYRISRGGQTIQERTRWLVAAQEQRIDPPGSSMYMIMDQRTRRVALVDDARRSIIDMQAPPPGPLEPGSGALFAPRGEDTVAGLTCTEWATKNFGADTLLCFTLDGALLRVRADGQTLVEAISVNYAPADPAMFRLPDGYQHVAPAAPR